MEKEAPLPVKRLYTAYCILRDFGFTPEEIFVSFATEQRKAGVSLVRDGKVIASIGLTDLGDMSDQEARTSWTLWATAIASHQVPDDVLQKMFMDSGRERMIFQLAKCLADQEVDPPSDEARRVSHQQRI